MAKKSSRSDHIISASTKTKKAKGSKKSTKTKTKKKTLAQLKTKLDNGKVYVPVWSVWISGKKLEISKKRYITSIEIKETVDGSDTATIKVSDPNFKFIQDNIYKENNKVRIRMGWQDYQFRIDFRGYISHVDIEFTEDGIPKLVITCMDNTYRMYRKKVSKTWKKKTSAQIVKAICKKYGYKCIIQKGYKFTRQDSISQKDTDIEFIQKLAQDEVYPFTARLVGKKFYYKKKGVLGDPKMALIYRKYPFDILNFNPKIDRVVKEIKKGSTSTKKKTASSAITSSRSTTSQGKVNSSGSTKSTSKKGNTKGQNSSTTTKSKGRTMRRVNGKWVPSKK